jgi:hypothetical protein
VSSQYADNGIVPTNKILKPNFKSYTSISEYSTHALLCLVNAILPLLLSSETLELPPCEVLIEKLAS